jgi:hypothetical protein
MNCENAQQNMVLAQYGELGDELQFPLEHHIDGCEECRQEWTALLRLNEELALMPMREPSPNMLAASRMRLDEALDAMPARSVAQRLRGNAFRWLGFMQGAPALATLLLGVGFLSGNFLVRYEVVHQKRNPSDVLMTSQTGPIASVAGIVQTPDSEVVQVKYNRLVPETMQGTLDDPQIRQLLMLGTKLATDNAVHAQSIDLLAGECIAGHSCNNSAADGTSGIRLAVLTALRTDKSPEVRLRALKSLQAYVAEDQNVRNAVLDTLMHDQSADVRSEAVSVLVPVQGDSSVRQVLRTVSSQDVNPAIRTASFHVLQGTGHMD